ncbi:MAG: hypothetical protein KA941_02875 [Flavobacteriales bacterium]|nr:hypothetical protein [Flavobacteriales bacterium]
MNGLRSIPPANAFIAFGHLLFIGLLVLAVQHWQLRTIHVDSACQIFKWINNDGLQIEAHRYTAIFPQLLVKLFAWCGASLASLLLVASVAHVLVPWAIFTLIAHLLRRPWHALGCALAAVLCTRLTFYGIVLEVNYLLSYPFLLAAVLDVRIAIPQRRWPMLLAPVALVMVLLVHPVGFLLALFVLALFFLRDGARAHIIALSLLALLWGLFGRTVLPPTGYEQGLYDGIAAGWESLAQETRQPALDFFFGHTWRYTTHYMGWWLLAATLVVLLVRRKAWGAVLVVVGGVVGFILLTVLTYHQGETAMMMEKNFLPLATMVALPLLLEVERLGQRARWIGFAVFAVVLFLQFRGISFASRPVGERFTVLQRVVDDARASGSGTVAMDAAVLDARGLHIHWALSYETLLLSGIDGPAKSVIVRSMDQGQALGHSIDPASLDPKWFQPPVGVEHVLSAQHDQ